MKHGNLERLAATVLPSLKNVLWIGAFLGAIGLGPQMMNIDGDLGRHLTIGGYILDSGKVPLADLFSHTMLGMEVTPHEWLAQVIFALAERWMGLNGVVLVTALVIATAFAVVLRRALREGSGMLPALGMVILAVATSSLHWLTRPHVFTFLMVAVWLDGLQQLRQGKNGALVWMPLVMLVWANLHGAFIAGFMLWLMYGAGYAWERWVEKHMDGPKGYGQRWLALGGLSALVTLINPAGVKLWTTSVGYLGNSYLVNHTAEYLSPDFHDSSTWPFLLMILVALALAGFAGKRWKMTDALVLTGWAAMGLYSVRNAPLFALAAAPLLAAAATGWLRDLGKRLRWADKLHRLDGRLLVTESRLPGYLWPFLAIVLVTAGFSSGASLDFAQTGNRFDPEVFPVAAAEWVKANPQEGEMFNYFPWGGYMLHEAWPERRVFIDGQTDFYGAELTREYETALTAAEGWEAVLEKYEVAWVLMPPETRLAQVLEEQVNWQELYRDDTAVIFRRK